MKFPDAMNRFWSSWYPSLTPLPTNRMSKSTGEVANPFDVLALKEDATWEQISTRKYGSKPSTGIGMGDKICTSTCQDVATSP